MLTLAALPVCAQRTTWVVDAAGGPGSQFLNIPAAIAAASPGDLIRVRAGAYSTFTLSIGLSIVADPGTSLVASFSPLQVSNVPAGQTAVLLGLRTWLLSGISVQDCQGRVILEQLDAAPALSISSCPEVWIKACTLQQQARITTSSVTINDSTFTAQSPPLIGAPALSLTKSTAVLSRCVVRATGSVISNSAPAIQMNGGSLLITGDGTGVIEASPGGGSAPMSAITGSGTVTVDPRVLLRPVGGAPPISGPTVTTTSIPSIGTSSAPLGGTVTVDIVGGAGEVYVALVGFPARGVILPPYGRFHLSSPVVVSVGVLDGAGGWQAAFAVPQHDTLLGIPLAWQAATVPASAPAPVLSNPTIYAHRP